MDNKAKSKSKLNFELQELQQKYDSLLLSVETGFEQSKLPKDVLKDVAEKKIVCNAYRKSEARYLGLLQNLEAGVVVHAPDTSVLMTNSLAEKILGLTSDQMKGKVAIDPLWKLLKEDTTILPFEEYPVNRIAKTKKSIKNQILGIHHPIKNSMVWATINGFPVLDTKGEIIEIVISFIDITERKLAEKSLAKSEENLRITLHSIGDGVISTDIAGRVTHMNPIAEKLIGWSFDDAKGKPLTKIFNIINAESRKRVENPVEKVMENGEIVGLANHTVLVSKNGSEYQIADSAAPIKNKNGLISGVVLVFSDITEKYATEKQLKESEERFNLAMNASNDGLFDWNLITNEIYYSPGWKKMLGYEDHEIPNDFSIWEKITDPEGVKKSWDMQQQLISKQLDRFVMEFKMKHKNGHWVDILSRGEAIFNESGDAIRMVGTHVDITKQRKVEKELKKAKEKAEESKEYLDNIINKVGDPLFVKDEESRLLLVNEAFCKLFGLAKSKIIGKTLAEDVSPEERESFFKIDKQVLTDGIENINEESLTVRGGETRTISTRKTRFSDINGKKYLVGVIRDITSIKKAQLELILAKQKAEESDRLKSSFLANMSHEIRTPMNGILGFSELLKIPNLSGEQQQKYIEVIEKSGNRMLNIINDIVDISKIEAGLMKMDMKESDINRQIEYLYTFFKPEVETKGMQLFMNNTLPKNEAIVETDREKLFAILTNLVKNAIKYSNKGSIEFGYEKKGDYLEFYVKDTGIGIPIDRQEAIFERFIQADIGDKMARQGAGLGLSITKAYVEMLGGNIWLESEEGVGSTFYFTLPYNRKAKEKNIPKPNEINHNTKNDFKNLKILIVEDDEASEILLSIYIREFSNEIINARTGVEAIEMCKKNPDVDLVLMDIQLPEMNGYETTRKIREFNKNVIIIAQTAYGLSGDREKSISAGCNDYMTKPIKKDKLESFIEKYFTQNL
ncbi:MAG: PAS domain S-box protein [Lutibacter sp.]|uniref:PAS domain S-box protein n=1 Tax=Lutibacter sp. TaxID=1925666 RepID=UPI00185B8E30|nr:PAS domain S-box protein [Lutibacter sp.]MBT8318334.1 PAS domain S-box protein [Lutibacter sp.]NNJ59192.1 PAS domain S-box protein [Lutibacter sp.]